MFPVPVQVAVPAVASTRESERLLRPDPVSAIPPFAFVVPASVIVPPAQVVRPDTLIESVPRSVPADISSVAGVIVSPLERFAVPALTTRALPMLVTVAAGLKVAAAPLTVVPDVAA